MAIVSSARGPYARAAWSSAALGAQLLRLLVAALGGSALPGRKVAPVGAQPLPWVLERAAHKVADSTAPDRPGGRIRTAPLSIPSHTAVYLSPPGARRRPRPIGWPSAPRRSAGKRWACPPRSAASGVSETAARAARSGRDQSEALVRKGLGVGGVRSRRRA